MKNEKLAEYSKMQSKQKVLHTYQMILEMADKGEIISFHTVAEKAAVSKPFLYRHEELKQLISDLRISHLSKQELQKEVFRLRLKVRELEAQLKDK